MEVVVLLHLRRGLRAISLRGLLFVVLALASAFGWVSHKVRSHRVAVSELDNIGCEIVFADPMARLLTFDERLRQLLGDSRPLNVEGIRVDTLDFKDEHMAYVCALPRIKWLEIQKSSTAGSALRWLRQLTHLRGLALAGSEITDSYVSHMPGMANITSLRLNSTSVGDSALCDLGKLKNLTSLGLEGTRITDKGLVNLQQWPDLVQLDLADTKITDNGLEYLRVAKKLELLSLCNTMISDQGIKSLCDLKHLSVLDISGTMITEEGWRKLKRALPTCQISRPNAD